MERNKAKEAGRKKAIREKANALMDKPPRKAPTKEAIKQAGRYHAIETAKKQLSEAKQAIVPDEEQQPYTAVDKVEGVVSKRRCLKTAKTAELRQRPHFRQSTVEKL